MAITSAFQADDVGSIPTARSRIIEYYLTRHVIKGHHLMPFYNIVKSQLVHLYIVFSMWSVFKSLFKIF